MLKEEVEWRKGPLDREGGLSSDQLFLVKPLQVRPIRQISQGQYEEPLSLIINPLNLIVCLCVTVLVGYCNFGSFLRIGRHTLSHFGEFPRKFL